MEVLSAATAKPEPETKDAAFSKFQSIVDFEKEQDALDELRKSQTPIPRSPPKKKQKCLPDIAALTLEAEALKELGDVNWVGRLAEFRAAHPTQDSQSLHYTEHIISDLASSAPLRFAYTVKISEHPTSIPSNQNVSFTRKKDAKQYASKLAIDFLTSKNLIPSDGSVRFSKPKATPSSSPLPSPTGDSKPSFASQVPGLCERLGFSPPTYVVESAAPGSPLYNGYAHFSGDPRVEGKVALFRGVLGRKNAKERCAEGVIGFLKGVERYRLEELTDDQKRMEGMVVIA